jgi:hypothetical protein
MREEEIGQRHFLVLKCEEEECGKLFCVPVDIMYNEPQSFEFECPDKHKKLKFIQSLSRAPIIPVLDDQRHR